MFFSKKSPNINSITIPTFGWHNSNSDKYLKEWVNPEETVAISINFFDLEPDLPTVKNVDFLRDFFRDRVQGSAGIIQVDVINLEGYNASKTILKISQGEMQGMTYIASIIIPFKKYSYVVKVQAIEVGMTGMRDASVFAELMAKGEVKIEDGEIIGSHFFYPYQKEGETYENDFLMNQSEKEIYDKEFPTHPLSLVRKIVAKIESNIQFDEVLQQIEKFDK